MLRFSVLDPLSSDRNEMGSVREEEVLTIFRTHPWEEMLAKMNNAPPTEQHYLPSIEFESVDRYAISVSRSEECREPGFNIYFMTYGTEDEMFAHLRNQVPEVVEAVLSNFAVSNYQDLRRQFVESNPSQHPIPSIAGQCEFCGRMIEAIRDDPCKVIVPDGEGLTKVLLAHTVCFKASVRVYF
ncbi:hypothetical protein [Horticoccus sp. 23ND18S-11]|uniref:hypothetical protein n=1 Tax=Horticoccus sp. 23ND18S-11 TaxID=3391832 RepID=UPI0039C9F397